jgi:hypothetical protein
MTMASARDAQHIHFDGRLENQAGLLVAGNNFSLGGGNINIGGLGTVLETVISCLAHSAQANLGCATT